MTLLDFLVYIIIFLVPVLAVGWMSIYWGDSRLARSMRSEFRDGYLAARGQHVGPQERMHRDRLTDWK